MSIVWQFATESGLASAFIRFGTRCDWSHVDAVMPDGTLLGARIEGGVQVRSPSYGKFSKLQRYKIETDRSELFYEALKSQIGKPYDWRAIIGFGLGDRDWQETDSWFCSELQVWAMLQAGFFENAGFQKELLIQTDRISPRDQLLLFSPWLVLYG